MDQDLIQKVASALAASAAERPTSDLGWSPLSWLFQGDQTFIFSLLVAIVAIMVWSVQRFDEPAVTLGRRGAGLELRPSDIFEGATYARGWMVFFFLLLFGYFFLVFMGPSFANLLGMKNLRLPTDELKASFPLLLLAFLTNILPSTPKFGEAERYVRALGQRALGFPHDVESLRNALLDARLDPKDFQKYFRKGDRFADPDNDWGFKDKPLNYLTEDDFTARKVMALRDWQRCCILLWLCRQWHGEFLRGQGRIVQALALASQELDDLSKDVKAFREMRNRRTSDMVFSVFIDNEKCRACGECVAACSQLHALELVPARDLWLETLHFDLFKSLSQSRSIAEGRLNLTFHVA